jgi:hypothetical protein
MSEYNAACFTICILLLVILSFSFCLSDIDCLPLGLPILIGTVILLKLLLGWEIKLDLLGRYTPIERVHFRLIILKRCPPGWGYRLLLWWRDLPLFTLILNSRLIVLLLGNGGSFDLFLKVNREGSVLHLLNLLLRGGLDWLWGYVIVIFWIMADQIYSDYFW